MGRALSLAVVLLTLWVPAAPAQGLFDDFPFQAWEICGDAPDDVVTPAELTRAVTDDPASARAYARELDRYARRSRRINHRLERLTPPQEAAARWPRFLALDRAAHVGAPRSVARAIRRAGAYETPAVERAVGRADRLQRRYARIARSLDVCEQRVGFGRPLVQHTVAPVSVDGGGGDDTTAFWLILAGIALLGVLVGSRRRVPWSTGAIVLAVGVGLLGGGWAYATYATGESECEDCTDALDELGNSLGEALLDLIVIGSLFVAGAVFCTLGLGMLLGALLRRRRAPAD